MSEDGPNKQQYRLVVPAGAADERAKTLAALVRELCDVPWAKARALCTRGKVSVNGKVWLDGAARVSTGSRLEVDLHASRPRAGQLAAEAIVFIDHDVVVVRKPAGLMTVRFDVDDRDTLADRLRVAVKRRTGRPGDLGVVQRLDKDTTGVMVFARTLAAKRHLQQQFRVHSIQRHYLALVNGVYQGPARIETDFIRDRGDGLRGSYGHFRRPKGPLPADAQRALTEVELVRAFEGASLVRCQIHTGRQHQIRIHLAEQGHPLIGEKVYVRDYRGTRIEAARPMLHAAVLGFEHPKTDAWMEFEEPLPADFAAVVDRLSAT